MFVFCFYMSILPCSFSDIPNGEHGCLYLPRQFFSTKKISENGLLASNYSRPANQDYAATSHFNIKRVHSHQPCLTHSQLNSNLFFPEVWFIRGGINAQSNNDIDQKGELQFACFGSNEVNSDVVWLHMAYVNVNRAVGLSKRGHTIGRLNVAWLCMGYVFLLFTNYDSKS